jgi:hypothetical protein
VDDGVPGQRSRQSAVRQVERGDRPLLEAQAGVGVAGHRDHLRGQVDAEGVQAQRVQMRRHPPGTAAEIRHRAAAVGPHQLGEGGEHRPVQRLGREFLAQQAGVVHGDGVVGGPGRGQMVDVLHGGED